MQFFGKYRGRVVANRDPLNLGRLQVTVPAVLGDFRNNWALPCVPFAGKKVGLYLMPPVGANVWVEFEAGDPDYPIWAGCFWGKDELPVEPAAPEIKMFRMEGVKLTMSSAQDSRHVSLELDQPVVTKPLSLRFDKDGITLRNDLKTSLKITADTIELANTRNTFVKVSGDAIELSSTPLGLTLSAGAKKVEMKSGSGSVTMTPSQIEVKQGAASAKVAATGIELNSTPASLKLSASGVEAASGAEQLRLGPGAIEASNGLGNVKVTPASVSLNNGALEVT